MSRSKYQTTTINLAELNLWCGNPRLLYKQSDEMSCIAHFIKDSKFRKLLQDIAKNGLGLNPIVVTKLNGRPVVIDGNRRVTALKLLQNPDLCPADLKGYEKQIKQLSQEHSSNILSEVECFYSEDSAAAKHHLSTTHIGEQSGAGHVDWNALMQVAYSYGGESKQSISKRLQAADTRLVHAAMSSMKNIQ